MHALFNTYLIKTHLMSAQLETYTFYRIHRENLAITLKDFQKKPHFINYVCLCVFLDSRCTVIRILCP